MLTNAEGKGKGYLPLLLVLILVALGLRLAFLLFQPLWWDEGWSLYFATADVGSMLELTAVDIHPPLYYLLLHLWTRVLSSSVLAVRLLSVLIGTATVPLLFVMGRRLWGTSAGLLAAFLLSISPLHIYYSQEVRMYGLVTLLGLAAFYFALRWRLKRRDRMADAGYWGLGLGYVLAAAAALYAQYYAAFLLLALNISALIDWLQTRRAAREILPWLGAQLAVVLLYLPWLLYAGGKLATYVRFKVGVEGDPALGFFSYVGRHLAAFDWGHAEALLANCWWVGLLPLALLFLALASVPWKRASETDSRLGIGRSIMERGHWPLVIITVTLLGGFLANRAFPFNPPRSERLLLLALPAYLLLVAAALLTLWRYRRWIAGLSLVAFLVTAILSLVFFCTTPRYPDDDYRPVAARVRALALPSDAIISVHPWQVGYFHAYIPEDNVRPTLFLTPREVLPQERQLWADNAHQSGSDRMAAELDAMLEDHRRIWLPAHQTMGRLLEDQIESYLVERSYPVQSEWYGENTVLSLFATGERVAQLVTAQFGDWLVLDSAALNPDRLQAGWGIVPIDLTWRTLERPKERYHVGLRLVDSVGHVWAQRDSPPNGGLRHFFQWPVGEPLLDRHGLLVPAGTPPGEYRVTLRVYRSHDVEVLPVVFEGGSGGEVTLGTVRVVRPERSPPPEALTIAQPLQAEFHPIRFLGFDLLSDSPLRPGEAVEADLFWQALVEPGEDYLPRLELLGPDDESVAVKTEKPVAGTYPTAWWRAGELVRDPHALPLPATMLPGHYRLVLSLVRAANGVPVEMKGGGTSADLATIEVQGREHLYYPTLPRFSQMTQFGPSVEFIGYELREVVRAPGSPLEVTLHWHALETPDSGYHSFVHLLNADGEIVAQHDGPPGEGELPALGWLPGEYLTDTHLLQLPFDLPDGVYRLGIGLYDPVTGQRPGERLLLDTPVPVRAKGGCNCR